MGRKKKSQNQRQARERSRSRENRGSQQSEESQHFRQEEDREEGSNSNQQGNSGQNEEQNQNQEEMDGQNQVDNGQASEMDQAEALASEIRSSMIDFFGNIKHEKGLVFTTQDRTKMIKEQVRLKKKNAHHQKIDWLAESDWNEDEEKTKITRIFQRKKHELRDTYPHLFASELQENFMKDLFLKSSYIYCNEVTQELYRLEMDVLLIILTQPDARKIRVAELMQRVCSANSPYLFFGFKFSSYHRLDDSNETKQAYQRFGDDLIRHFLKGLNQNVAVP